MPKTKGRRPQPATMTADEFREILDKNNLSQSEAAEVLGFSRASVNKWACGRIPIRAPNAAHIRQMLLAVAK